MKSKLFRVFKNIGIFILLLLCAIFATVIFEYQIYLRLPFWETIEPVPEGNPIEILEVDLSLPVMFGSTKNTQAYILTDTNSIYEWNRKYSITTAIDSNEWRVIFGNPQSKEGSVTNFVKQRSYFYVELDNEKYYTNNNPVNRGEWIEISKDDFDEKSTEYISEEAEGRSINLPKPIDPFAKVIDRSEDTSTVILSQHIVNYVLTKDGEIMMMERALSIIPSATSIIFGIIFLILLNIFVFLIPYQKKKRKKTKKKNG